MAGTKGTGPNSRVVEVMNFLAAHPTESFTLSEIASRVGLSKGSAHRVLTTLAQSRYLYRHPKNKTYSLGMALVAIGQAALAQHGDLDVARREIRLVAAELDVHCMVSTVAHGELLILACEGTPQESDPQSRIGDRRPFIPPLGMGHVAWAEDDVRDDYLSRAPAALSARARERLAQALDVIKERGYGMSASGPATRALWHLTQSPVGNQPSEAYWAGLRQLLADMTKQEIQLLDLDETGHESLAYITAPVFSPSGEVMFELSINGMSAHLSRTEMEHHVERLRAAALAVTRATNGRTPQDAHELPGPEEKNAQA